MIQVQGLRKVYGEVVAVDEATFMVEPGEIFGLLGPNGAGKTTTIGCISGLLRPTSGRVRVLGHDVVADARAARAGLGVVPQEVALYEELSATDNLRYWGAAYGLRGAELRHRVAEVLEITGLADRAREPVKRFSGGMKRRLNFACGIVHRPRVLLLDEPTAGVDAQTRVRLLELVRSEARAGTCVLYTTHYMEEAESLCDRLAVMDRGRLLAVGTLPELRRLTGERDLVRFTGLFDPARVRASLGGLEGTDVLSLDGAGLVVSVEGASRRLPALFGALAAAGADVRETIITQPSLEALFIKLTGRELRE